MRIRSSLVSNSSSSSFTAIGFKIATSDYGEEMTEQEKALADFILEEGWDNEPEDSGYSEEDLEDYLHDRIRDMTGAKIPGTPDHKLAFNYIEGSDINSYVAGVEVFSSFEDSLNIIEVEDLESMIDTAKRLAKICGYEGKLKILGGTIYC